MAATLLASPRASAGMAMLASLAAWFGEVIRDTYRYISMLIIRSLIPTCIHPWHMENCCPTCRASPSVVDLSYDVRRQRCAAARAALLAALPALRQLAPASGEPGALARRLILALQALDEPP